MKFALVLLLACCACAPKAAVLRPTGAPWLELRTPHFVVRTDLPEATARARLDELEAVRAAMRAAMPATPNGPRQLVVFAPATAAGLADLAGDRRPETLGLEYESWYGEPVLVIAGDRTWIDHPGVATRLAYGLVASTIGRAPLWLRAGLIAYLETLEIEPGGKTMLVGPPHSGHFGGLQRGGLAPTDWLVRWRPRDKERSRLADTGWLLVNRLATNHRVGLAAFLHRVADGEEYARAFQTAFPETSFASLDAELKAAVAKGAIDVLRLPAPQPPKLQPTVRPYPEVELRAMRAEIGAWSQSAAIGGEADAALALDPTSPAAIPFAVPDAKERVERGRASVAAHPDDFRAHLLFWSAKYQMGSDLFRHFSPPAWVLAMLSEVKPFSDPEMDGALERAFALAPENVAVAGGVASARLSRKDYAGAAQASEAALRAEPGSVAAQVVYSDALAGLGRCPEALRAISFASERLPEVEPAQGPIFYGRVFSTGQADLEEGVKRRLEAYRGSCTPIR